MIKFKAFLMMMLIGALVSLPAEAQQRKEAIAAVVNAQAITASDVDDRLRLIMVSAHLPNTNDVIAKVRPQVIGALVEEAIKKQEAQRLKISTTDEEVEAAIGEIAKQNNMTADQFKAMFKAQKISLRTLRAQIESQLLWVKVVTRQIRPQIEITDSDVDAELDMLRARIGQDEYHLAEIVLPIDRPQDERPVQELAAKMIMQIRAQPDSFSALARQFSKAAGAAQGGDIGWISAGQLPVEIDAELPAAQPGSVIGPVKTTTGLYILLVREKRTRSEENLPDRDAVRQKIGMERLERMQRRYFLDLRSSGFIENRE